MKTIFDVADANNLIRAYEKAKVDSSWKESVQLYETHLLENTYYLQSSLLSGEYAQKPFFEFDIHERGKVRHIKSNHISDRVVQRSLCDNVLNDLYRYCIYDNGASIVGKGIDFARKRFKTHLRKFILRHGVDGYILKIDFKKFFDNIPHNELLDTLFSKIKDERLQSLITKIISGFKVDVSYMDDNDFKEAQNKPIDILKHSQIKKSLLTGNRFLNRSVAIGSQVSQVAGVFYPTRIDTYCKYVKGIKFYGRYMDDIYVIHESKDYLKQLLCEIKHIAKECKLFVHEDKTQIIKLSHGFTFLQIKYVIHPSGKIVTILSKKATNRERKRLKKLAGLCLAGVPIDFCMAYKSWRGNAIKYHAWKRIRALDELYFKLAKEVYHDTRGEKKD